ncbi:MAG: 8-amino-7-oxononanoate synthase [Syntrophomonadaceae bacterium]|nr:8-amino-7-oxononanoate synthase [Syntrophomonadaceae bacterium]
MEEFYQELARDLRELQDKNLFRGLRTVSGPPAEWVEIAGKRLLNLSSNNYLGLAGHPLLKKGALEAVERLGCGATASRLIVGNFDLYEEAEKELADFKNTEAALIFNSGYTANVGIITSLVTKGDLVLSDKLNHASIIDGILLSKADYIRYQHRDLASLEKALDQAKGYRRKLIVTDTVFSMDGGFAPLPEIVALKEHYGAILMIDEAHGGGIFGDHGRGVAEFYDVAKKVEVNMGTLSKAFGCAGAYVAGKKILIDYLLNKARSLIFTTGLPPAVVGSILAALQVVKTEKWRREQVLFKAAWMRERLQAAGFNLLNGQSQIIPVIIGDNETTLEFSRRLMAANILAVAIRPPTVPANSARLRLTVMATHREEDLEMAVAAVIKIGQELQVI